MKTIEEVFNSIIRAHCDRRGQDIKPILEKFESEIRKDQDKITRHACAEVAINQGGKVLNSDVRNELHRKIMNTKAIKEGQ